MTDIDFFVPVPLRFVNAYRFEDIDPLSFGLGCYLAAACYEVRNTAGGVATIRLSTLAELFGASTDTISRRLRELEKHKWIACEVKPGERTWRIRLTGLAPHNLRTTSAAEPPPVRRLCSAETEPDGGESPDDEGGSRPSQPPQPRSNQTPKRDETRREKALRTEEGDEEANESAFLHECEQLVAEGIAYWVEEDTDTLEAA